MPQWRTADFHARFSATARHYLLSHPQSPQPAGAGARPRLACRARAGCRGDASRGAGAGRPARLHHLPRRRVPGPVAGQDAGPAGCRRAAEEIHIEASARSFLHHQIRSFAGTLKLVGEGKWHAARCGRGAGGARPQPLRPGRAAGWALSGAGWITERIDSSCRPAARIDRLRPGRFRPRRREAVRRIGGQETRRAGRARRRSRKSALASEFAATASRRGLGAVDQRRRRGPRRCAMVCFSTGKCVQPSTSTRGCGTVASSGSR